MLKERKYTCADCYKACTQIQTWVPGRRIPVGRPAKLCWSCRAERRKVRARAGIATRRRTNVANGLCRQCGRAPVPGRKLCEPHLEANADQQRRRRVNLVAVGMCVHCGKLPGTRYSLCAGCRDKINERRRGTHAEAA